MSTSSPPLVSLSSTPSPPTLPTPTPRTRSLKVQLVIGALSGCGAVTISNPFEVVKTRLQLQGELQKSGVYVKQYRGFFHAMYTIASGEGLRGIQKGLFLAYPYTIVMNGTRLGSYEPLKRFIAESTGYSPLNFLVGAAAGMTSGAIGSIIANPFYIAKTRTQSYSPLHPVGHQHAYTGPINALVGLYKSGGVRELFQGTQASCMRMMVATPVQLLSYDFSKRAVISWGVKEGIHVHILSSVIAGLALALALNPFDVVTTRMYNQKYVNGKGTLYSGIGDCFRKTIRTEGFFGLYKGLVPHYARLAPHTIMLLVLFEQISSVANHLNIY